MVSKVTKDQEPIPYQALLDENNALKDEIQSLRARLEEPEELQRAIREGDLDALVMPVSEEDLVVFTLNGADQAYRTLMETANEDVLIVDGEFKITYAGKRFINKIGYSQEEVIGRPLMQFIDREYKTFVEQRMEERRKGVSDSYESKLISRDGSPYWAIVSAKPLFDNDGNFTGTLAMLTDITERKRVEEELRESEQRFRLALRNAPVSVAAQDRDLRYIWAYNQRTVRPEEIVGHFDSEIFTPEEAKRITTMKRQVLDEGIELREQMWFNRPSGRIFLDVTWEPMRDTMGRVTGVMSATVDLTSTKLAEEALRKSEERFRAVQENSLDRFTILKPFYDDQGEIIDFTYIYQNAQAAKTTGHSPKELVGRRMTEIFPTFPQTRFFAMYKLAVETGQVTEFEDSYHADGVDEWFCATVTPIPEGIAIATQIITERKKAEEMLQESEAKYHGLFNSMAEASSSWSCYENGKPVDYIFLDVNPAWERMTGLKKEQVLGCKASEVIGSVESYWPEAMDRALRTGEIVDIENYGVALDKWYSVNMWKFSETACGVIITDITERKRTEEELAAAHSQIQSIINNTPDIIYAFDLEERFVLANTAVANVLNTTPDQNDRKETSRVHAQKGRRLA